MQCVMNYQCRVVLSVVEFQAMWTSQPVGGQLVVWRDTQRHCRINQIHTIFFQLNIAFSLEQVQILKMK